MTWDWTWGTGLGGRSYKLATCGTVLQNAIGYRVSTVELSERRVRNDVCEQEKLEVNQGGLGRATIREGSQVPHYDGDSLMI